MMIQKPAPHDRFIKSGRFDQSYRQPWDEQYVRDKFVNAPGHLIERLGTAITRRRQFIEYRKSHHERVARPEVSDGIDDSETVVSSLPTVVKQDQGLLVSELLSNLEDRSDAGESVTSYAETVAGDDALLVPKMPEAALDGAMFECPYCFAIIDGIHTRPQWKYV